MRLEWVSGFRNNRAGSTVAAGRRVRFCGKPVSIAAWLAGLLVSGLAAPTAAAQAAAPLSCSLPGLAPDAKQKPDDAALLAAWNTQAERVHSVEASVALEAHSERERTKRPSPALVNFRAPGWLRVTGEVPFSGKRSFDLFSNGQDFWLIVPDGKSERLFTGPVDAPEVSKLPHENLRPRPLIDALHWQRGSLSSVQDPRGMGKETRTIRLDLPAEAPFPARTAAVEFDLRAGVVNAVAYGDAQQRVVLHVDYDDWRQAEGSSCYPRHIAMNQPLEGQQIDIRIALVRINGRIPGGEFRMNAPIGIAVTHLAGPEGAGHP
ncbi:MAG: hypothetical protein WCC27_03070 [Acidobacteriaceae bacterium]